MYNAPMFGPPVFVNRKDLKRAAKEDLRTARPRVWKVTLVYLLLTSGLFLLLDLALSGSVLYGRNLLAALLTSTDPQQLLNVLAVSAAPVAVPVFFLQILLQLYAVVLEFGYCGYTLRRSLTVPMEPGDNYRLRVWLRNGDCAWVSPIFCR